MSTISGLGGSSGAWAGMQAQRAMRPPPPQGGMPDELFSKIDSDSDGSVNGSELSELLSKLQGSESSSSSSTSSSEELLAQWDSDGSGSLSKEELGAGLQQMMPPPPPPSTMSFAQSRGGGKEGLMSLDADDDGSISASEFGLNEASSERMQAFFAALDGDGDQQLSGAEVQSFEDELKQQLQTAQAAQSTEKAAAASETRLSELVGQLVQRYLQAGSETATPQLSLSA